MTTDRSRAALRRRATGLLDQQLWCWGRDIVRPDRFINCNAFCMRWMYCPLTRTRLARWRT